MTCWRRLREWQQAGIWSHRHRALLQRRHYAGKIDWERAALDSANVHDSRLLEASIDAIPALR